MAQDTPEQPIIIVRKKRNHDHGHHGGAWKVAYADFVTAMMAFFLLLWLLNTTTDEQKSGIADYFDPTTISRSTAGSGGVLGGMNITVEGARISAVAPPAVTQLIPGPAGPAQEDRMERTEDESSDGESDEIGGPESDESEAATAANAETPPPIDDAALEEALAEREAEQFEEAAEQLRQAIQSIPDIADMADNLIIDQTPEGLRIQIVDQEGYSMFPLGSSAMYPETRKLLELVAQVVGRLPNKLSISGHTDSQPFARTDVYDNWELSTDRANASRRALTAAGVEEGRISTVVGRADRDHLFPEDPNSPRNRRISIVLLRESRLSGGTPGSSPSATQGSAPAD